MERERKIESKEASYRSKVRKIRETDSTLLRIANGGCIRSPSPGSVLWEKIQRSRDDFSTHSKTSNKSIREWQNSELLLYPVFLERIFLVFCLARIM